MPSPAARFVTPLITRQVDERANLHELLAPLVYDSVVLKTRIRVPKGFRTDFASVPRLPLAYMLTGGKGSRAAVVHDYLYSGGIKVSRAQADKVLREALQASGYGWFTVALMYAGVRLGGAPHFDLPNVPQLPHVASQMEAP